MKTIKEVKYEHYDIRYRDEGNMWAFLGNGRVKAEVEGKRNANRLAPYIRNTDTPWTIE